MKEMSDEEFTSICKDSIKSLKEDGHYRSSINFKELLDRYTSLVREREVSKCDICGRHPSAILQTPFGRFCQEHARYI